MSPICLFIKKSATKINKPWHHVQFADNKKLQTSMPLKKEEEFLYFSSFLTLTVTHIHQRKRTQFKGCDTPTIRVRTNKPTLFSRSMFLQLCIVEGTTMCPSRSK